MNDRIVIRQVRPGLCRVFQGERMMFEGRRPAGKRYAEELRQYTGLALWNEKRGGRMVAVPERRKISAAERGGQPTTKGQQ